MGFRDCKGVLASLLQGYGATTHCSVCSFNFLSPSSPLTLVNHKHTRSYFHKCLWLTGKAGEIVVKDTESHQTRKKKNCTGPLIIDPSAIWEGKLLFKRTKRSLHWNFWEDNNEFKQKAGMITINSTCKILVSVMSPCSLINYILVFIFCYF